MNDDTAMWEGDFDDREVWEAAASLFMGDASDGHTTDPETLSAESNSPTKQEPELFASPAGAMDHKQSPGPTRTRRINRRREEILFLRDQVHELEQRLSASHVRIEESVELAQCLEPMERELLASAWETVAAQQLAQRRQSEAEHDQLVAVLEEQRQLAKALQRYARRQHVHEMPAQLAVYAQLYEFCEAKSFDSPASFDELQRAVVSMYDQRNAVFCDPRFDTVLSTLRASRVVNEHTSRACFEMLDARVLPFDINTTATALWESMVQRVSAAVTYNNEAFEVQNGLIKKSFVAVLDLPHFQTSVRGKVVARRLVEGDRIVIMRATLVEPISLTQCGDTEPFSVRHYQWQVIEAPHHERLRNNSHAISQVQSFDLSFPSLVGATLADPAKEHKVLQFCETAAAYHLDLSRQALENLLVGSSFRPAQTSSLATSSIKLEAC